MPSVFGCRTLGFRRTSGNQEPRLALGEALDLDDMATQVFFDSSRASSAVSATDDHLAGGILPGKRGLRRQQTDNRTCGAGLKAYEKEKQRLTKELDDAQHELVQSLGDD